MGIDWRCINGYIYISGNPVLDPEKIGRARGLLPEAGRLLLRELERALREVAHEDGRADRRARRARRSRSSGSTSRTRSRSATRRRATVAVLDAYRTALRLHDVMWQHHFEFLLLGYGAYMTFAELCKANLPDIPDQHIAQMVAGLDVLLFRPDAELRRLAHLAIDTGVDAAFVEGRSPEEIDAELAKSDAGRAWLAELEKVKEPVVPHGDGRRPLPHVHELARRSADPVRVADRPHRRAEGGRGHRAADRRTSPRSATGSRPSTPRCSTTRRGRGSRSCSRSRARSSRTSRSTSSSATTGSSRSGGTRSASSATCSSRTASSRTATTSSSCRGSRCTRRSTSCADVGDRRAAARPEVLAADRRAPEGAARAARRLDAAAGGRRRAGGGARSGADHALGRDDAARPRVGARSRRAARS